MESIVYIIGHRNLQNELICRFLEEILDLKCELFTDYLQIPTKGSQEKPLQIVLWDYTADSLDDLWTGSGEIVRGRRDSLRNAIFNTPVDAGIELEALHKGINGVFHEEYSPSVFAKGVHSIINGELWYPRKALTKCVLDAEKNGHLQNKSTNILTRRETEILMNVASGARNEDIAEKLCISMHTVKTHVYNIYKKLKVSNRLQASLWASRNL